MNTNTHLIELERELEADLADARRHIELGRRNAIDQLNSHRESLGEHCGEAALKIDLLAADAERELKNVRTRLGELNLLLAVEEIRDLETFDQFRDRILEAMADAEHDLGALDQSGAECGHPREAHQRGLGGAVEATRGREEAPGARVRAGAT